MNNNLWLFDYQQGQIYDEFSKCEDYYKQTFSFLKKHYNFQNRNILEIGAGSGKFTSFLAKQCKHLYVLEKSESLMKINQEKNINFKNIEFILSDVKNLNLPKNCVDFIFAGWSLTSMRNLFNTIFPLFKKVLNKDGYLILVENAGNDDFSKLAGIENFTNEITQTYLKMGFIKRKTLDTIIRLPNEKVFYDAFPNLNNIKIASLDIKHKILILDKKF